MFLCMLKYLHNKGKHQHTSFLNLKTKQFILFRIFLQWWKYHFKLQQCQEVIAKKREIMNFVVCIFLDHILSSTYWSVVSLPSSVVKSGEPCTSGPMVAIKINLVVLCRSIPGPLQLVLQWCCLMPTNSSEYFFTSPWVFLHSNVLAAGQWHNIWFSVKKLKKGLPCAYKQLYFLQCL